MDLDIKEVMFIIKIIDLDDKIFAEKAMVSLIFKINSGGIYIAMVLIN